MDILKKTSECNIEYHELGETDRSAMPIGNGDLCASVWTDKTGTLNFYLAKSDAITESDRNVKLAVASIKLNPNPFVTGIYKQTLDIVNGFITVEGDGCALKLFISNDDIVYITGETSSERIVSAEIFNWRAENEIKNGTVDSVTIEKNCVCFRHINGENIIAETARVQAIDDISILPDLLTGRIFGGSMTLETDFGEITSASENTTRATLTGKAKSRFECRISALSAQTDENAFIAATSQNVINAAKSSMVQSEVSQKWNKYWEKSYIFVNGDEQREASCTDEMRSIKYETCEYSCGCKSKVTLAYTLTKYMTACCEDGKLPIYYNGMLFNLCPGAGSHLGLDNFCTGYSAQPQSINKDVNPDERSWSVETLWQNVRLPYYSMLARGEANAVKPLFDYYRRFWELNRYRAKKYYNAEGQHNTEMTYTFGLQSIGLYGADRMNKPLGYADNRWGGAVDVSPGLELASLMLDYYDFTSDKDFLINEALPFAEDMLKYIETRFKNRENGRIVVGPLQSVETYWDTIDPVTVTAGMRSIVEHILRLPEKLVSKYSWFCDYKNRLPMVAVADEDGKTFIQPARAHDGLRHNVENPEFYSIFPFGLYKIGKPELQIAVDTFVKRTAQFGQSKPYTLGEAPGAPSFSGWQYEGPSAALLGLTESAEDILTQNCALRNPGTRFPAMWGPAYDAVPDTDHGANILNTLQLMVMQSNDDEIRLLPSFPEKWDVSMKLWADCNTSVECEYKNGKLSSWKTEPADSKKRVIVNNFSHN